MQTKLEISKPGDEYEQEADRISEQVMRMPEPQPQRACACDGACPKCRTGRPGRGQESLQTKRVGSGGVEEAEAPHVVREVLRSPGQPLDPATRAFMEPRFGYDFSRVRLHSGTAAEQSAVDVNAHAYTVGHNIVFGAGRYAPGTSEGRRLLAHELTHVVQQSGSAQLFTDKSALRSSTPAPLVPAVQRPSIQRDKAKPNTKAGKTSFNRAEIETIKTSAETRHESITTFIRESRGTLRTYKSRLLTAAALYKAAFNRHKAVLDKAREAAADRKEMISTLAGFAVGVTLGVPGAVARIGLKTLAERAANAFAVGGELTELFVSGAAARAAGESDAKAFETTAEIPELKELAVWRTIAEMSDKLLGISLLTAKQMKIVSAAGTAITEISLREGGAKNLKKTDAELLTLVGALKSADETSGEVATGLRGAKTEIDELGATPARHMTVDEVEQDIWIEWIADLTDDDLLDKNDITDHLEALGVIGEGRVYTDEDGVLRREPPRLDVNFGSWVSDEDEADAVNAARAKLGRQAPASQGEYYYDDD